MINKLLILSLSICIFFNQSKSNAQSKVSQHIIIISANIDHSSYDKLLKKYVNNLGLVDYRSWRSSKSDMKALKNYIKQFKNQSKDIVIGQKKVAAEINLYNALTLNWMLHNKYAKRIKDTNSPWSKKRHVVFSKLISLNNIEHGSLRKSIGYKAHAVLVCAAKSCPPLPTYAYSEEKLNEQIDIAFENWLAREDLNEFDVENKKVKLSRIFKWYESDFKGEYDIHNILLKYSPEKYHEFLKKKDYKIEYKKYNWEVNSQN